jgi:hypothetical protein
MESIENIYAVTMYEIWIPRCKRPAVTVAWVLKVRQLNFFINIHTGWRISSFI